MNAEQVTHDIEELESLRSQTRSWRTAAVLAVIIVIVAVVMTIVNSVKNLALAGPTRDEFVQEFQAGFSADVIPQLRLAASDALGQLAPLVKVEFQKLDLQSPRLIEAAQKELVALQESLPARAENVLESTIGDMLRARESRIRAMYPNLTDEKVALLMDNLLEEGGNRTVKVMDELFKPHQDTFDQILAHLDKIQTAEAANIQDEKPTWDMAILFFDVIKEDLHGLDAHAFPNPAE